MTADDRDAHTHGTDGSHAHEHGSEGHVHGPHCNHGPHEHHHGHARVPGVTVVRSAPRVGRNDPCPCGSGQKYKKCCLDKAA